MTSEPLWAETKQEPVSSVHFPSPLHAVVWRNWQLVTPERMAEVVGTSPDNIIDLGRRLGLSGPPEVTADQRRRSYVTVIRRNWHLLPYAQIEQLLGWTPEHLQYILREDDFLFIKLGMQKPHCEPVRWADSDDDTRAREEEIANTIRDAFPEGVGLLEEPLFQFVHDLSAMPAESPSQDEERDFSPRYCYSYFAPYGDSLLEPELDPYPDGLLARLAACGLDGVWLQGVLYTLSPFPWREGVSEGWRTRLANLNKLVQRARQHGLGVYLYLNEPRAMPLEFFDQHPELKGAEDIREGGYAALCTSVPAVRDWMRKSIGTICREVPDLAGFFTITFSENWTNCWAHAHETNLIGGGCARCAARRPEEVLAEVNATFHEGIVAAGSKAELIAWDWIWPDEWMEGIISRLPKGVAVQSVSEWDLPITRGGHELLCGEYSISTIGPAPRALRTWQLARDNGLKTIAKIQGGNSWEVSSVPYIPAVANVAKHAEALREEGVGGFMQSWTLGGYPGPGLEVFNAMLTLDAPSPDAAMKKVATRWFGPDLAAPVVEAWKSFSAAFSEYPFSRPFLYFGPIQTGPANPLWLESTGYGATMVGYPYDSLAHWTMDLPASGLVDQLNKVADGFEAALAALRAATEGVQANDDHRRELEREMGIAEAVALHCRSAANQVRFVELRDAGELSGEGREEMAMLLRSETELSVRLHAIQCRDSRISFEASNHYMYVPVDLAEKVLNCRWLLEELGA